MDSQTPKENCKNKCDCAAFWASVIPCSILNDLLRLLWLVIIFLSDSRTSGR